jgi:DNA-binding Lrp family transcriptional regulator
VVPLRPHDVVVALQLALTPGIPYRALAEAVGLSQGEVHNGVRRLVGARLVRADTRAVHPGALLEFLAAGVPYAFPASLGAVIRGVPTAHAAPPLSAEFPDAEPVVWPALDGTHRGAAVEPLHTAAPGIARRNPALYELLTLVDALRVGRARERHRARALLTERLAAAAVERR